MTRVFLFLWLLCVACCRKFSRSRVNLNRVGNCTIYNSIKIHPRKWRRVKLTRQSTSLETQDSLLKAIWRPRKQNELNVISFTHGDELTTAKKFLLLLDKMRENVNAIPKQSSEHYSYTCGWNVLWSRKTIFCTLLGVESKRRREKQSEHAAGDVAAKINTRKVACDLHSSALLMTFAADRSAAISFHSKNFVNSTTRDIRQLNENCRNWNSVELDVNSLNLNKSADQPLRFDFVGVSVAQ